MRSRKGARQPARDTQLDSLRANHKQHYDAVDGVHWGCICEAGSDCLYIVALTALTKAEQEVIRLLGDARKQAESHQREVRDLASKLAGAETYSRHLKEENDVLRQRLDSQVS